MNTGERAQTGCLGDYVPSGIEVAQGSRNYGHTQIRFEAQENIRRGTVLSLFLIWLTIRLRLKADTSADKNDYAETSTTRGSCDFPQFMSLRQANLRSADW